MSLNILFRADASGIIGSGHVMRCLTLANQLKRMGMTCRFACRDFEGNLIERIEEAGFDVTRLPVSTLKESENWLGASIEEDVQQTVAALGSQVPDWVVVDHYSVDQAWEKLFLTHFPDARLLVIDDLANRDHHCECLVDLSPGRKSEDYRAFVGDHTKLCLGLDYALLRKEFREARASSDGPRLDLPAVPRVLVSFGGSDASDYLIASGEALRSLAQDMPLAITVIGASSEVASHFPEDARHLSHTSHMAEELTATDIMVCAAGGTNWERCCLGVPGVVIQIADNQAFNAAAISSSGIGTVVKSEAIQIETALRELLTGPEAFAAMSARCWELCDGQGAVRIASAMVEPSIRLTECVFEDARFVYEARYGGDAHRFYKNPVKPDFADHENWFRKALSSEHYALYCVELGGDQIAHVRFDPNPEKPDHVEIGIALHETIRGLGLAVPILRAACNRCVDMGFGIVDAEVHKDNLASLKVFQRAGFSVTGQKDELLIHLEFRPG